MSEFIWNDELVNEYIDYKRNEGCGYFHPMEEFKKSKVVKGYLFITEDNVIIYEGDYYYSVNNKFCHSGKNNGLGGYHPGTGEKYFSTMDAASEYILCNKPLLSLDEVFSKCNVDYGQPDSHPLSASLKKFKILRFEELKELAKQKLK